MEEEEEEEGRKDGGMAGRRKPPQSGGAQQGYRASQLGLLVGLGVLIGRESLGEMGIFVGPK